MSGSAMSLREKAVFASLLVAAMYAAAVVIWFTMQESAWSRAKKDYARQVKRYVDAENLIRDRGKWTDAYELEKSRMPMFDLEEKNTDTPWRTKMSEYAKEFNFVGDPPKLGDEVAVGDVFEREILLKNYEGSLESLVKFMYELENSDKGMFDMKKLSLKPQSNNKQGYLKWDITITCAYMKRDVSSGGKEK